MDDGERKVQRCVDCRAFSPEANTNHTLISARHGWRLHRRVDTEGKMTLEWRCPNCWTKFKEKNAPKVPERPRRPSSRKIRLKP
jgi:hypothetical protein